MSITSLGYMESGMSGKSEKSESRKVGKSENKDDPGEILPEFIN
jgi:hypothetical protein